MHPDKPFSGPALAITGAALQTALLVALLELLPAFSNLFYSVFQNGLGDPAMLIPAFEEITAYCRVELILALLGLVLLGVALTSHRYRARWFFRFLVVYGVLLLPVVPVGTVFGLFFLSYCLTRRREFAYSLPRNRIGP